MIDNFPLKMLRLLKIDGEKEIGMPTIEPQEVLKFMELIGTATIMVAKSSFSPSKFHNLMDTLRNFTGDTRSELKNSLLKDFLTPDGFVNKKLLFEQIKSELLGRTQNLLATFLDFFACHDLRKFLSYEENTWNQKPMRGFGPKFKNDLKTILLKYGLRPGMKEHELNELFGSRWQ